MSEYTVAKYTLSTSARISLTFIAIAITCFLLSDIAVNTQTPWQEFSRLTKGFLSPTWLPWPELSSALANTVAIALLGVTLAAFIGFLFSLQFHLRSVRTFCVSIRAVHELFWGLLLIQLFGLHPIVGVLAIAIPYSGIFAKVYSEIIEESEAKKYIELPGKSDALSRFLYGRWALIAPHFASYTRYRFECGLRSSTVLGFIGIPSLGFHLESGFMQGDYGQVAALLLILYGLIASIQHWARAKLVPVYLGLSTWFLWAPLSIDSNLLRNLITDMVPRPLRTENGDLMLWLTDLIQSQILPGAWNTVLVTQMTLVLTGVFALSLFPALSKQFSRLPLRLVGHGLMVVLRSTPEIILAFIFLLLWGPSMLPAVVALTLHNGAILSHLIARHSNEVTLRDDTPSGLNRYLYEILPRTYGQFLAFLCYRWEVILRESAIVGILGIHTLGFFIDSAFESFRLDQAILLIVVSAALNIAVDHIARTLRLSLHLKRSIDNRSC